MIYIDYLSQFTDWRPTQNYWQRFSITEKIGLDEVGAEFKTIFNDAKGDYKRLTELVMVLNHKSWQQHENTSDPMLCRLYARLFKKAYNYAIKHLEGDALRYFLDVTD